MRQAKRLGRSASQMRNIWKRYLKLAMLGARTSKSYQYWRPNRFIFLSFLHPHNLVPSSNKGLFQHFAALNPEFASIL